LKELVENKRKLLEWEEAKSRMKSREIWLAKGDKER
jgi:hypothetical protein